MNSSIDTGQIQLQEVIKSIPQISSTAFKADTLDGPGIIDRRKPRKLIEDRPAAWVKRNGIECRECIRFYPAAESLAEDPICCCGYPKSQHTDDARECTLPIEKSDGKPQWSTRIHTQPIPTNAIGEMEFIGFSQKSAKYIRVAPDTPTEKVWNLMTRVWKLQPPHLVISVTGGAKSFKLTPRLKEVFRKGLMKAAISTNAWITSGGTYTGVMKYVGEAYRDLAMGQSAQNKVVCLGIATWGCISNKESLVNRTGVAKYTIGPPQKREEAPIDCNHSHIILVDDGTQHQFAKEIDFRARLEKTISEKSNAKGSIILVVVEGGPGTLKTVYESIKQQIPALIIGGSRRAADILAFAYENSDSEVVEISDQEGKSITKTVNVLTESVEACLIDKLHDTFKGLKPQDITELVEGIKQCLMTPELLSVYQLNRSQSVTDIDLAILKALFKANQDLAIEQLRLCLIWNRVDVAKTDIFSEDKTFKSSDLNEVMLTAIKLDRVDFVKLFLQCGVSLRDFLTDEKLLELYNTASKRSVLHWQLGKLRFVNTNCCSSGTEADSVVDNITLEEIGRLIEKLLGSFYRSSYTRFKTKVSGLGPSKEKRPFPERDLFVWCILMDRCDMAKVFWEEGKDSLAAALVAHGLLKALEKKAQDNELRTKLEKDALDFQNIAIGILNTCYLDDDENTSKLLLRTLQNWGKTSCINIAVGTENKEFIAQRPCQDLFKDIWWGGLESSNGYWIVPVAIFPFLIPFSLKFKRVIDENASDDPNQTLSSFETSLTSPSLLQDSMDGPKTTNMPCGKKFIEFFISPATKLAYNVIFFLLLLLLYSYVMLIEFFPPPRTSIPELVLVIWVGTLALEEVRQLLTASLGSVWVKMARYMSDRWNWLDMLTLGLFFLGFTLRNFPSTYVAARLIWAINLFGFFVRLLHFFAVSKLMGPKLVMISKMMGDLMSFMGIMFVFIVGFGVTSHSILYRHTDPSPMLVINVLRKAYWQIFAELFLEDIEGDGPTAEGKIVVPILLAFYMLLTNVLLLNLLIAMFSNTYTKVQDQSDLHWHFQHYKLTQEYEDRPFLPPPFVVISHVYRLIKACKNCKYSGNAGFLKDPVESYPKTDRALDIFEENRRDEYVLEQAKKMMETTDFRVKETLQRVETLTTKIDDIQRYKTSRVGETEEDLQGGQADSFEDDEKVQLKERIDVLEDELIKTNDALEWIVSALKNSKITPQDDALKERRSDMRRSQSALMKRRYSSSNARKQPLLRQLTIEREKISHTKSLTSPYPFSDVKRVTVPEDYADWNVDFPSYNPPFYTAADVLQLPAWADKNSTSEKTISWNQFDSSENVDRVSYEGKYITEKGCPLNPRGRTGLQGRGLLGRWGPNHAADPIVTRWKRSKTGEKVFKKEEPLLQFVATKRKDNKHWSLPGGFVMPNEDVNKAIRRQFTEEALSHLVEDELEAAKMDPVLTKLFSNGEEVYKGYVDDSRNTDNAWVETRAMNYHDEDGTVQLQLRAGESEDAVAWLTVSSNIPLHANHLLILQNLAALKGCSFN